MFHVKQKEKLQVFYLFFKILKNIINWAWVNFNISNEANLYTKGTSEINQIKCPIFISYSQKDNIVTKEMVDINIKAFPNAKVFTIENGGHCVHLEDLDNISEIILNLKCIC